MKYPLPKEPPPELLLSMAIRSDHGLGCPGYYDQPMFAASGVTHEQRVAAALSSMRQLYEEVSGYGFYHWPTAQQTSEILTLTEIEALMTVEPDITVSMKTRLKMTFAKHFPLGASQENVTALVELARDIEKARIKQS